MLNEVFAQRFTELNENFSKLQFHRTEGFSGHYVESGDWKRWATSAESLIRAGRLRGSPGSFSR